MRKLHVSYSLYLITKKNGCKGDCKVEDSVRSLLCQTGGFKSVAQFIPSEVRGKPFFLKRFQHALHLMNLAYSRLTPNHSEVHETLAPDPF